MSKYYTASVEEKDDQVFIYRPLCPTCGKKMVQGKWEYYKGTDKSDTFQPERLYKRLLYVCKFHLNKQVDLTQDQLTTINKYVRDRQNFVDYEIFELSD